MANKTTPMLQIRRILQLKSQGKSNRDIARELHKSRNNVNAYVKRIEDSGRVLHDLLKLTDEELSSLLYISSPPVPADWRCTELMNRVQYLSDELRKPHATRIILWEEYRQKVPDGYGYTQFCEHLNRYLEPQKAVMHFEHEPAASMMFDFAGDTLSLVDKETGEITKHPVLVCVLPFSAFTYVEVLRSAKRELLLKALNNAFSYFGGVPLAAKTDNMTQIVKKANRYEPSFDELSEQWAAHYGCALMAARVRKPRDKASVESHVNVAYNRIYAPLRNKIFYTIDQANEAFGEQMDNLNARNLQRQNYSRRDRFNLHEKPHLLPLPPEPFIPKTKVLAKVQRNYHVTLGQDWHHYSVHHKYLGKTVQIVYDTQNVEIYLDLVRLACHRRNYHKNGHTTLVEHMPPNHRFIASIKGWDPEYFLEKAARVGSCTHKVVTKVLEQKRLVEQTYNSCLGISRLSEKYGNDRLEAACKRALAGYKVTYTMVKDILERNLDKAPVQDDLFATIPDHENIRGPASYQ
jgi:transposase